MLIITNRNVIGQNGKKSFGEKLVKDISYAEVKKDGEKWKVDILGDENDLLEKLKSIQGPIVFFVHGFQQSFEGNLKRCHDIEVKYKVSVIAFSWPSNPTINKVSSPSMINPTIINALTGDGISANIDITTVIAMATGNIGNYSDKYNDAKKNARESKGALNKAITMLGEHAKNRGISLLVFSLGNYLFQQYIQNNTENDIIQEEIFKNVILCQADVNIESQNRDEWIDNIDISGNIYATINQNDWVLNLSRFSNEEHRLGQCPFDSYLESKKAKYFDFTEGAGIGNTHGLFYREIKNSDKGNQLIRSFFDTALRGVEVSNLNGFRLNKRGIYEVSYDFRPFNEMSTTGR